MKKFLFSLIGLMAFASQAQAELTGDALRFRNNIKSFLQEEGFSPYVDSDDDLCFKKEGNLHWISFSNSEKPVYVRFNRATTNCEGWDIPRLLEVLNDVNRDYRCIKATLSSNQEYISYAVESYYYTPEDFKYSFYKYLDVLNSCRDIVNDNYREGSGSSSSSASPMSFNSASVRNENAEGEVITDWGVTIYSYRTRYLTPKINVTVRKAGNYDIYVKMYGPDGLTTGSNSPSGYSYKTTKYFSEGTHDVKLTGWGSDTAGHWNAGNYRFEFYLNNKLLGTKYFTIK